MLNPKIPTNIAPARPEHFLTSLLRDLRLLLMCEVGGRFEDVRSGHVKFDQLKLSRPGWTSLTHINLRGHPQNWATLSTLCGIPFEMSLPHTTHSFRVDRVRQCQTFSTSTCFLTCLHSIKPLNPIEKHAV